MSEEQYNSKNNDSTLLNFLFDEEYYRTNNKDLNDIDISYLDHYLRYGWKEGRDPSARFCTNSYLEQNKDVADSGLCPLWHFVTFGFLEGREVTPTNLGDSTSEATSHSLDELLELGNSANLANYLSGNKLANFLFDRSYYLDANSDVRDSLIDPFVHYFNYGWKEGRDPNKSICVKSYMSQHGYHDGIEPISHYIFYGKEHGFQLFKTGTVSGVGDVYKDMMAVHRADVRKPEYSPRFNTPLNKTSPVKTIAMYLPQFHPFRQNDEWWGKGFTEWRNVAKAVPQFAGHYQPRLPGELGYYDLRLKETFEAQISLAKDHGVDGFCFHYYWFGGTRLMEKPLDLFLENKDLDIEFCLCWANENWTRRWDGSENDVLIAQEHSEQDNEDVFNDLNRYFADDRYIKVDGKPLIVVYRPAIIPDVELMLTRWRELAVIAGFEGLHILCTNAFGFKNYKKLGFDGVVEFPPHDVEAGVINSSLSLHNDDFTGFVYNYTDVISFCKDRLSSLESDNKADAYYPTVMTAWDNSARKPGKGNVFHNATPQKFHDWFDYAYNWADRNHPSSSSFVFVNAWNEWAEGTYLEPDLSYGYAYLNSIRSAINEYSVAKNNVVNVIHKLPAESSKAIFVHIYYEDMIGELTEVVNGAKLHDDFDVIVTYPSGRSSEFRESIAEALKPKVLLEVINRGRDVYPFLCAISECEEYGYEVALKLHSKKSKHLKRGDEWKQSIYASLTNKDCIELIKKLDFQQEMLGIVCPTPSIKQLDQDSLHYNKETMEEIIGQLFGNSYDFDNKNFIAGTMFWFNFNMMKQIVNKFDYSKLFGPELGAIDGTSAHAFERLFLIIAEIMEYKIYPYDVDDYYYPY
ncbi:glycoside hydrolase family 99-like domain-containing protein [Alteromonas sp. DY56-G5]|uniref:glycoside hydrolase family 99-like domain-containing protein n=1 Tax=Alteromonas sp. DY56-G5 TaxID=2967128 RepID=UPI00352A13B3